MPSGVYKRTAKSRNRFNELSGKRFGKLLVISEIEERKSDGLIRWNCKCDCGNNHIASGNCLRTGRTKSCGCLLKIAHNKNIDRKEQLIKYLYKSSRMKNIGKDMSFDFFKKTILKPCFYCGEKSSNYSNDIRNGKKVSNTILYYNGLDRIDSNKLYTEDNVVSCCKICNRAKNDMKQDDFYKWIKKISNFNK